MSPPEHSHTTTASGAFNNILYGPSGVGKTSFVAHFPNLVMVVDRHEKGIFDLLKFNQCPEPQEIIVVDGWKHLLETCEKIALKRNVQYVGLDALGGFEQLCFAYHCKTYFDGDWSKEGFLSYMQGPKNAAKTDWPDFIECLETIKESGKSIWMLAHSQIKAFANPEGPDYDRYSVAIEKDIWAVTHRWAENILFYKFQSEVKREGPKHKGNPEKDRRIICCEHSVLYDAKQKGGLPPVINAGTSAREAYQAFCKHYGK